MVRGRLPPTLYTRPFRPVDPKDGPRLWNAKRRIKTSTGLTPEQFQDFKKTPPLVWFNKYTKMQAEKSKSQDEAESPPPLLSEERAAIEGHTTGEGELEWWKLDREHLDRFMDLHPQLRHVSDDVRTFISHNSQSFQASTILQLLQSPVRYFSASSNVPLPSRQQVYFPDTKDAVVLMRTPHLGPRYAAFDVPRHFSKLDLRAYLKNIYNVDVLHIRSVVVQEKVTRKDPTSPYSQGALFRPPSKKKMTVQLVKPFVYPEEFKDLQGWEHDDYWKSMKSTVAQQRYQSEWQMMNPNPEHRKSIAQQAQQLLRGNAKWAPTWQELDNGPRSSSTSKSASR